MYLWLPENVVACEFHRHWGFVYIVERYLISPHLFRLCLHSHLYNYDNYSFVPFLTACLTFSVELPGSWLSILSYWPSSYAIDIVEYRLLLCSCTIHAKLLTLPLRDGYYKILQRSQSVRAVLSYNSDLVFPLLSVYASCSSSVRYNIYFTFRNCIAMSLATWVTQAQTLKKCFKLLISSFHLCFWECAWSGILNT